MRFLSSFLHRPPSSADAIRAVKFTSRLFQKALSKRIKATILYATETGKSEKYARLLGELFSHAFNAQVTRLIAKIVWLDYPPTRV
jgi:hypothetical protein